MKKTDADGIIELSQTDVSGDQKRTTYPLTDEEILFLQECDMKFDEDMTLADVKRLEELNVKRDAAFEAMVDEKLRDHSGRVTARLKAGVRNSLELERKLYEMRAAKRAKDVRRTAERAEQEALEAEKRAAEAADKAKWTHVRVIKDFTPSGSSDTKRQQETYSELFNADLKLRHCSDLVGVRQRMVGEFPYAMEIIDKLLMPSFVQVSVGKTGVVIRPTVIVGLPGLGKSRLCRRLCAELGVFSKSLSVAGYSDDMIFGLTKGWSSANASLMLDMIKESMSPNPVIIMDEIEKINQESRNGNIQQKLLPLLEPAEAKAWLDPLLGASLDLSAVGWLFTANSLEGITQPLRSRVKVYEMQPLKPEHVPHIVRIMKNEFALDQGLDVRWMRGFDAAEMSALVDSYTAHRSVRILKEQVRSLVGAREMLVQ